MGNPFFDFKKKDEQQNPGLYKNKSVVEKAKLAGKRYRAQKGSKKIKGGAALNPAPLSGGGSDLSPAPLSGGGSDLSPALVSGGGLQPLTPTPLSGGKKFKSHYMYTKKGKKYIAKSHKQHLKGVKLGHTHKKPKKSRKNKSKKNRTRKSRH